MKFFNNAGKCNTEKTVELVVNKAEELGIKNIVIASMSGETALKFKDCSLNIVCVSTQVGALEPGKSIMSNGIKQKLESEGIRVLMGTQVFAGVDRALRLKSQGIYSAEIIADSLKMFGQGMKVCIEVATMALDSGLIPYGEEIIAVGGTMKGADTAIILNSAHSQNIFDTNIKEIICMPRGH